jgi:2-isopropylmalate synthase
VGANAFAHSAGIHQDGILKDRSTYEIMRPEDVGIKEHSMVLTARSGRAAVRHELKDLGFELEEGLFERVFQRFIDVADRKKEITAKDLSSIVEIEMSKVPETYTFIGLQFMSGDQTTPLSSVRLQKGDEIVTDAAIGNGPVDATYRCIERRSRGSHGPSGDRGAGLFGRRHQSGRHRGQCPGISQCFQ